MKKISKSFVSGAIALVFAILGYQTALLVHYAAVSKIIADRDRPDTVYVYETPGQDAEMPVSVRPEGNGGTTHRRMERRNYQPRSPLARKVRESVPPHRIESFRFDPNTASVEELLRLGFSRKQAESIANYRAKGGRFRRKSDFAASYAVPDSVFRRLEPYIDIPLLDINTADSAAFDALPGIGGYFARKMVEYRRRLKGYSNTEQLMEIYRFDRQRYEALKDMITLSPPDPYPLWTLPEDSLRLHPYIGKSAKGIVFYREHNPGELWSIDGLAKAGVISEETAARLRRCVIAGD